jgi:hypothetical protein
MKIQKRCHIVVDNQHDVTAATTVTAIWSAKRNKFLTVNRDATVSTTSSRCVQSYAIYEGCHLRTILSKRVTSSCILLNI